MENLNNEEPKIIEGGLAVDDRGQLSFANGFSFLDIKRFYIVENFSTKTIRAWHGHLNETKYVLVASGSALISAVRMDDVKTPNKDNEIYRFTLSERKPSLLYIPAGYANGFRSLEEKTKIIFFSTSKLEDSKNDDYRFPIDYWGKDVWEIENR
jgi:dTDP-4-dehydrorhamnose 3,5-epimerase-like enzyme